MSKPSKSQSQAKTSSSSGSMCPPTARSLSLLTADALTDPNQIPTALSNSVNTAIGASPSGFETSSGMSDTSAGSNRNSNSEPRTAKSAKSHEVIMNDLRRGSLFGRQSQSQATEGPKSVTNITFSSNNTNLSTASESQSAAIDGKKLDNNSQKELSLKSLKTGKEISKSRFSSKKFQAPPPSSTSSVSRKSAARSPKQKMKALKAAQENDDFSGKSARSAKSTKSAKTARSAKSFDFSGKSGKSAKTKKGQKVFRKENDFSKKSKKSAAASQKNPPRPAALGQSGVVKKGDQSQKANNNSVYFPMIPKAPNQVPNQAPNQTSKRAGMPPGRNNRTPVYNFPGTGRCTRNMDTLAPINSSAAPSDNSNCVYDVAALGNSQRRFPASEPVRPPPSLFKKPTPCTAASSAPSERQTRCNKIVVVAATPDGKTQVQMTIDMQIVAGEGLGQSGKPVELVPKKILMRGEEIPVEPKQKRGE